MLSQEDLNNITAIIHNALSNHSCACGLSPGTRQEVPHFFGMIRDVGGGEPRAGVERIRSTIQDWAKFDSLRSRIMGITIGVVVTGVVSGLLGALWVGIKTHI